MVQFEFDKNKCLFAVTKWVYIKYVGVGARGFYKFFKKYFVAQRTIELNISRPSNFFEKNQWPLPLILASHLRLTVVVFQGIIHRNIQSNERVNIHNNIQTVVFRNNT